MLKRSFDIFFSALSLLCFAPLLAIVSLCSLLIQGRPIFFRQRRIGKDCQEFSILKFRTMSLDESKSETQRIGAWGKFLRRASIDELPELFNILKGEMSFVGPRPLLPEYLPFYSKEQNQRHNVIPGLTGLAQVNGRNAISWSEKFRYDVDYVKTQSFIGDVKIIFQTALCVFKRSGINSSDGLSMHRFDDPFYIIGSGGHGKSVHSSALASRREVFGFLDDSFIEGENKRINGTVLKGKISSDFTGRGIIGIGSNQFRKELSTKLDLKWESIIHPSAVIDPTAKIGKGVAILAGAHIGPNAIIGNHTIINTHSNIEHDCIIGDFCHIAPGATLCGGVHVNDLSFVGAGSSIIPGIQVGENVVIGAGSTVVRNLKSNRTYIGSPVKELQMKKTDELEIKKISISMASPIIDQDDIDGVVEVLKSGHLSLGPKIVEFEKSFEKYTGCKHGIAVSSGTAALHLILLSMGIGEGDEVLVPSFTFVSSVSTILHVGATPVFVDIDPETYCIDPLDMESKITSATKAIMGVDIFGHPADWPMITQIAKENGLYTIDDSCEALGAAINNKKVGSFADASTFAFYPNKQITTGEGGMIVTDNDLLAERMRMLRNHGRSSMGGWLKHDYLGYNFRMDEMSAALGVTQMNKIDRILDGREAIAKKYNEHFKGQSKIRTQIIKDNVDMSWFVYVVTLEDGLDRDHIISKLQEKNIPARAYFDPIHSQPFMKRVIDQTKIDLPITDNIAKRTIALPFHAMMTSTEIEYVATTLKTIVKHYKRDLVEHNNDIVA